MQTTIISFIRKIPVLSMLFPNKIDPWREVYYIRMLPLN